MYTIDTPREIASAHKHTRARIHKHTRTHTHTHTHAYTRAHAQISEALQPVKDDCTKVQTYTHA